MGLRWFSKRDKEQLLALRDTLINLNQLLSNYEALMGEKVAETVARKHKELADKFAASLAGVFEPKKKGGRKRVILSARKQATSNK